MALWKAKVAVKSDDFFKKLPVGLINEGLCRKLSSRRYLFYVSSLILDPGSGGLVGPNGQ